MLSHCLTPSLFTGAVQKALKIHVEYFFLTTINPFWTPIQHFLGLFPPWSSYSGTSLCWRENITSPRETGALLLPDLNVSSPWLNNTECKSRLYNCFLTHAWGMSDSSREHSAVSTTTPRGKTLFFFFFFCYRHAWIRIAVYHCFSKLVLGIRIHSDSGIRTPTSCFLYGMWQYFPKSLWCSNYTLPIGTLCLLILVLLVTCWSPATQSKLYYYLVAPSVLKALGRGVYYITG